MPESQTRIVPYLQVEKSEDGVILRSIGWSQGTGGSWTALECEACSANFHWSPDAKNMWLPNLRYLNHCPGCGKTITGFRIPAKS